MKNGEVMGGRRTLEDAVVVLRAELGRDAALPVDDRAEDVEQERVDVLERVRRCHGEFTGVGRGSRPRCSAELSGRRRHLYEDGPSRWLHTMAVALSHASAIRHVARRLSAKARCADGVSQEGDGRAVGARRKGATRHGVMRAHA